MITPRPSASNSTMARELSKRQRAKVDRYRHVVLQGEHDGTNGNGNAEDQY